MKALCCSLTACCLLGAWHTARAAVMLTPEVVVEPDNYPAGADLTTIVPEVTLGTSTVPGLGDPVTLFRVTSETDPLATTGTSVFGHAGIPFFNTARRLRMEFNVPILGLSIDFAHGQRFGENFTGLLELYDANKVLLETIESVPVGNPVTSTTISAFRPAGDIAFAVAYTEGSFGRFDNLIIEPVPEPATAGLAALSLMGLLRRRRR